MFRVKTHKEANNKRIKGVIILQKSNPLFILPFLILGFLSGCHKDLPEPEAKSKIAAAADNKWMSLDTLPVYYQNSKEIPSFFVQHTTKGNNVFIECILTGISFRNPDHSKQKTGKLLVWIDGKRNQEVASAAFIIKGLPPGNHKVKLEVVDLNNKPYGLTKEFLVNIPR